MWTCERIGPKCNLKCGTSAQNFRGALPPGGSLGTGKRGTVPKNSFVLKFSGAVPALICCDFYHNAHVVVTKMVRWRKRILLCHVKPGLITRSHTGFFHGSSDKPRVPSLQTTVSPHVFFPYFAKMSNKTEPFSRLTLLICITTKRRMYARQFRANQKN